MGTIYYAVAGEGRGHATRARAMIEDLRKTHRIVVYTSDLAYEFLRPFYERSEVEVRAIPGPKFFYNEKRRLDYVKTGLGNLGFIARFPRLLRELEREMIAETPDLVLADFEPSLPRVARRLGVPFLSLDHQHFLLTSDLSSLPFSLRCHAASMAPVVKAYYRGQVHTVVSSFYFPPLRSGLKDVTQIGVLLRPEILKARPESGPHVVAYLRRFSNPELMEALASCGCEVRIYGLGERPGMGRLRFFEVDMLRFVEDLATSRALVSTAGNQLIGEALYLGKPVFAMPEEGNREQEINAHFLDRSGAGISRAMREVTRESFTSFLDEAERYRAAIDRDALCGNRVALEIVERYCRPIARLDPVHRRRSPVPQNKVLAQKKVLSQKKVAV